MVKSKSLLEPVLNVRLVPRDTLKPNDYNPNKVLKENLDLLEQSILVNGWTAPIVIRPDCTIIDGYHRWLVAGRERISKLLDGNVPVVVVKHEDEAKDMYGTITHNRARGVHLLEPMERIVQRLLSGGKKVPEIAKNLGMRAEEVYRLSGFKREDFLAMLAKDKTYSKASMVRRI